MHYLDFDNSKNVFNIMNTTDQSLYAAIPRGIMDPSREKAENVSKRFKWMDSDRIKIINKDGMEKVVNIHNNFEELAFGQVPMIDIKDY
jgi:hypothetical protein